MRKGIYVLPNLFTSASLFSGFYGLVATFNGEYVHAAVAVLVSAIFDSLDGKVARLTGTTSRFGVEFDSLADLVSFGVTPAALVYAWALRPFDKLGWLAAFLFVICGALRLARFNVQISTVDSKKFNGLPIPGAASLLATTILLFAHFEIDEAGRHVPVLLMVFALSFLMVSRFKYNSFKDVDLYRRQPFYTLVLFILLLLIVAYEPQIMLFTVFLIYAVSGPVGALLDWRRRALATASPH
ncbi:MAG TPA: CDP-diacylglycerol--serine O-phosphatidyltransferase [Thermodesulfobacteriota bacterium]|nr:CDP-diacylglycerol--serine O-phosphatidyltransferase [Thermodesulfobacteriota bacterium]